jgi:hypothetical protein
MLRKIGRSLHLSQYMLRDTYITPVSLLADRDPLAFTREFSLDADELNLLIHDKPRAQKVVKTLIDEERALEKEREKIERLERKRPVAASSGSEGATSPKDSRTPSREGEETGYICRTTPANPDREVPVDQSRGSESDSDEEREAGKRTQKTLFDGF